MKVIMDFDPELGRKILRLSAGSVSEEEMVEKLTDSDALHECFKHGCVPYGFSNMQSKEE